MTTETRDPKRTTFIIEILDRPAKGIQYMKEDDLRKLIAAKLNDLHPLKLQHLKILR